MNTGLAPWLIFEFVFSLYLVFLKFWVRIFFVFCIFEIVDSYFFLFCIFEHMHLYFFGFFYKKITKNIEIKYKKYTLTAKNVICIFAFFFGIFQPFTDCTLSFCIFFVL